MKIDIVVLNYNGKALLEQFLPGIVAASHVSSHSCKVIVLDNASSDDSAAFVKKTFPDVDVVSMRENRGFCSYNDVAKNSTADLLMLLNNDIKVTQEFIDPLAAVFQERDDAFFAGPKCFLVDGKTYDGMKSRWRVRYGMFEATAALASMPPL